MVSLIYQIDTLKKNMENIILTGMPGSGKTTLGKILAEKLGMKFIDFDDDVIESQMWKSVWELLWELWDEGFKEMEEKLWRNLRIENTVLGCSGSLVYAKQTMENLKKQWTIVYLKVPAPEIEKRLEKMKTQRIIGMRYMSFEDIFFQREKLYEIYGDLVFEYSGSNMEHICDTLISMIPKPEVVWNK